MIPVLFGYFCKLILPESNLPLYKKELLLNCIKWASTWWCISIVMSTYSSVWCYGLHFICETSLVSMLHCLVHQYFFSYTFHWKLNIIYIYLTEPESSTKDDYKVITISFTITVSICWDISGWDSRLKMSSSFGAEPRGKSLDSLLLVLVVAVDVSLSIAALAACKFHTKI